MTKRSPEQVYQVLIQAGFSPASATTMTAIAGAESGFDDANLGDVNLENGTWGPSYGLFQVRTQKGQTGTGQTRDVQYLAQSDLNQAKAAYSISSGGTNFSPWTTFTSGKYKSFLSQAQAAVGSAASGIAGLGSNVGNIVGDTVAGWVDPLITGFKGLAFQGVIAAAGIGLLLGGAYLIARPQIKQKTDEAVKVASTVAKVAI